MPISQKTDCFSYNYNLKVIVKKFIKLCIKKTRIMLYLFDVQKYSKYIYGDREMFFQEVFACLSFFGCLQSLFNRSLMALRTKIEPKPHRVIFIYSKLILFGP